MISLGGFNEPDPGNPIDLLEELVSANDWAFDRPSDEELAIQVQGNWVDYHIWTVWQPEMRAMSFACHFDFRVPEAKRRDARDLVARFNETLWLGHFDFVSDDGSILFRHTMPLRGTAGASVEQLEDLVDTAVSECERFYPALQLVVWGGQASQEALAAALMETVGEA
jgi:hypothetical protein